MLQAYIDESVRGDLLVMAGYIATARSWATFSEKWAALLDMRSDYFPRLDEFHMAEMNQSEARREMVPMFYRLIEDHVERGLAVIINITELHREYDKFPWPDFVPQTKEQRKYVRNPYVHGFRSLQRAFEIVKSSLGVDGQVDFIFDENTSKADCMIAWEHMQTHKDFRETCGARPIFRDSKKTMPLQAADLLAYWHRQWFESNGPAAGSVSPYPWPIVRNLRVFQSYVSGEDLRKDWQRNLAIMSLRRQGLPNPEYYFPEPRPTLLSD